MNLQFTEEKGVCVLNIQGQLDASAAVEVDAKISETLDLGKKEFIFDLEGLDYISSAGLGAFISHIEYIKEKQGRMVFCNLKSSVLETFELLGLTSIVNIATGLKEAKDQMNES